MIKHALSLFAILSLLISGCAKQSQPAKTPAKKQQIATGIVFHDENRNQKYNVGEKLLADVRVSNGRDIVKTDAEGRYRIPVEDDTVLFLIQPRGWRSPLSKTMLPRFYYVHKPAGSPKLKYPGSKPTGPLPDSINFPLYPQKQPEVFKAILFGDPQPRNQKEVDYIAHDVVEELIGTDASFGVTLGDITFDDLSLFESQARTIALMGIPWYNVIGNHDINLDAKKPEHANETFESFFGPSYYSFDFGKAHFLVLDDIEWHVREVKTKDGKKKEQWRYRGGLGEKQMEFIRNDLALIPKDQMVVLMMHIPLVNVRDRQELYRLIEKRPFCLSISGHTHHHEHRFIKKEDGWQGAEPHHHIINVTVCGSWWKGAPDERGIPHATMADGAPNGYSILTFDGNKYVLDFKAAGRSADYQMNVHAPEVVEMSKVAETDVYVNVFNGSERSRVEMRFGKDGDWMTMKKKNVSDPAFVKVIAEEKKIEKKTWLALPGPKKCPHLWHSKLPKSLKSGTHLMQIRTTDMHGRTFQQNRVIRVSP